MKQIIFSTTLILTSFLAFSQTKKAPIAKKPGAQKTSIQAKAKPAKEAPAPKPIEKILTPAEKRQLNLSNAVTLLLGHSTMIGSEYQEKYEIMPVKTAAVEYRILSDTAAIVLCKNRKNHTIHKMDVRFSEEFPQKIYLYSLNKMDYNADIKDAKWGNGLSYSYSLQYDSTGKLSSIIRAYKGWETVVHHTEKFRIAYKGNQLDSIENVDHMDRKRNVVYYNGKSAADSIYSYSISMPSGKVNFESKVLYTQNGNNDWSAREPYSRSTYEINRVVTDSSGHITLSERRHKGHYESFEILIDMNTFEPDGSLKETRQYKEAIYIGKDTDPTETVISKMTPYVSQYVLNDKKQVVKQIISYHDRCQDSEETITYAVDDDGFVTETKSKKDSKFKCRY